MLGNERTLRNRTGRWVLLAVTLLGLYVCYRLTAPFMPALVGALALAVIFSPLQSRLEAKLKRPSIAAGLSVLIIGLIVVIPAAAIGHRLVLEAAKGAELIESKLDSGVWRKAIEAQPHLAPVSHWVENEIDLKGTFKGMVTWLTGTAGYVVKGSLVQAVGVCLTFYLLFYFLRDRELALRSVRALSPLAKPDMDRMFHRISDTIHAMVYGTLIVASVQGLLGGLMFWWLDLPAPLLWGLVMTCLAIVPMLGAFIVWIPAALVLALEGNWGKAMALTLWGMFVVGTIDNLLRPILVGNRLRLHTVLAFISVVGGLTLFGPSGLILGPVALTLTTGLLEIWSHQTKAGTSATRQQMQS